VTGFDDYPLATLVTPQLTTVRQPLSELGKIATTMVLDQIDMVGPVTSRILKPELIVRDSTAPAHNLSRMAD
jgi:LacI family transcriptional regulator